MRHNKPSPTDTRTTNAASAAGGTSILALLAVGILSAPVILASPAESVPSEVRRFADAETVGTSTATFTGDGVSLSLRTTDLTSENVVTLWWVVFNYPAYCENPTPFSRCGAKDLAPFGGSPAVNTSVLYAAGTVVGGEGKAGFGARLNADDLEGRLFGWGLVNPSGAEVHVVVRDHGDVPPQERDEAIHSFGVCYPCTDVQFAAFVR